MEKSALALSPKRVLAARTIRPHVQHAQRAAGTEPAPLHPAIARGLAQMHRQGDARGAAALVRFSSPTLHVSYVWFKSEFPLPLHSHDVDCYYLVIAGSMRVGSGTLEKDDGVLIPGRAPYTVTPLERGVEFLEIRSSEDYDTHYRARTDACWDRLAAVRDERKRVWPGEAAPYGLLPITL